VIRRGFWLTAGAVTGIYGYRRVSALGRRLSASLNPADAGTAKRTAKRTAKQGAKLARPGQHTARRTASRTAIRAARETYRFTRDVREGMDLYMARHSTPAGSTLGPDHDPRPKDGR
jgi:hypothetical protein